MSSDHLHLLAPAKINLFLKVIGRRPDGYHQLATLMQKVSLYDSIYLERTSGKTALECPGSTLPVTEENITLRAAHLFFSTLGGRLSRDAGVHIVLEKKIPIAAGLGGGSSDAATVLVGLDKLYATGCSKEELAAIGERIGADVPFFVYDWPVAWATGIGERIARANGLENVNIILVNPGFPVSTKWVYENLTLTSEEKIINLTGSHSGIYKNPDENPFAHRAFVGADLYNDLEQVTEASFEEISQIKQLLVSAGASHTMMSGSGPTVFGIFPMEQQEQVEEVYQQLHERYDQTFLVAPLLE